MERGTRGALVAFGIGAAIGAMLWLVGTPRWTREIPFDDPDYWGDMIVLAAVLGVWTPRSGWLTGLGLALTHLAGFLSTLRGLGEVSSWRAIGVFLAFTALLVVVADLASSLRRAAVMLLARHQERGRSGGPVE
jgi:hypothetical protein